VKPTAFDDEGGIAQNTACQPRTIIYEYHENIISAGIQHARSQLVKALEGGTVSGIGLLGDFT
jgi:hypothetical protein